jgi:hypothetical protein
MKILSVTPPNLVWNINASWEGEDAWFKFEYLHDDGTTSLIQQDVIPYCSIPESDDFVKVRVSVLSSDDEDAETLATENVLIRPR